MRFVNSPSGGLQGCARPQSSPGRMRRRAPWLLAWALVALTPQGATAYGDTGFGPWISPGCRFMSQVQTCATTSHQAHDTHEGRWPPQTARVSGSW